MLTLIIDLLDMKITTPLLLLLFSVLSFSQTDTTLVKTKRKKKRVFKWDDNSYANHMVENGKMKGLYYQNGVTKELILTW